MSAHRIPQADEEEIVRYAAMGANSVLIAKLMGGRYSDASIRVLAKRRGIALPRWRGGNLQLRYELAIAVEQEICKNVNW